MTATVPAQDPAGASFDGTEFRTRTRNSNRCSVTTLCTGISRRGGRKVHECARHGRMGAYRSDVGGDDARRGTGVGTMSVDPSAGILALLAHDDADLVRMAVASNQGTPIDVLRSLADDAQIEVRASLAANRATPVDVLRFLSNDFSMRVRRALAGFEWKVEGMGHDFLVSRNYDPRYDAKELFNLGNRSVPADVLTVLSTDEDIGVQVGVAGNAATPTALLRKMAVIGDYSDYVLEAVASNPCTPDDLLRRIVRESFTEIQWIGIRDRRFAAQNLAAPLDLLRAFSTDKHEFVREGAAQNPFTPVECLRSLARDENEHVRGYVARNPSTPVEVLDRLSASAFRYCVAGNLATPVAVLRSLAADGDGLVRWEVVRNLNTPVELLAALAGNDYESVRSGVAGNASTPLEVLQRMASDEQSEVRAALASNPRARDVSSTPPPALAQPSEIPQENNGLDRRRRVIPLELPGAPGT